MYFANIYNNYYPYYSLDAASIVANEDSLFTNPEDDLTQIVENILNKYLKNNYLEYEKEELCQRLELIIQDQVSFIYQSKIFKQTPNMTSFPYNQIDLNCNPFYNANFSELHYPNSKRRKNLTNKTKKGRILKGKKVPKTSIEKIRNQAEKGDVESMVKYGIMLREGNGVKIDEQESIRLFKKAAEKGSSQGMAEYALTLLIIQIFENISCDKHEIFEYCKRSAEMGNADGMALYGSILSEGLGVPKNLSEAVRYIKMAVDKGSTFAMIVYAYMLAGGFGIPKNLSEAVRYFKLAIDKGNTFAMIYYAYMLADGEIIPKNLSEAVSYIKMAIDKGNTFAMTWYAVMLAEGIEIPKNSSEAVRHFKMAIDKGCIFAMTKYESMIKEGHLEI